MLHGNESFRVLNEKGKTERKISVGDFTKVELSETATVSLVSVLQTMLKTGGYVCICEELLRAEV